MPFDIAPIQSDEQQIRIMQEPKEKVSRNAVPPKVKVTNNGRAQQDNPSLFIIGNYDWNMIKSYVKKAQLILSLIDLENPNHEPAGQANGGQFAEGQGTRGEIYRETYGGNKRRQTSGGGFAYHATALKNIDSIYDKGLLANFSNPFSESRPDRVYLATNPEGAVEMGKRLANKRGDTDFAVLKVKMPTNAQMSPDPDSANQIDPNYNVFRDMDFDPFTEYRGKIDPSWIVGHDIHSVNKGLEVEEGLVYLPVSLDYLASLNKVPSDFESGILSKVIKGERSANGYRSYWLLENGEVKKSIVALTDEEADEELKNA